MNIPTSRTSRFTLIELLVVVAIIAVLASMLLPALAGARDRAVSTQCRNGLKSMGMACQMYQHDSDNWITPIGNGDPGIKVREWPYRLIEYLGVGKPDLEVYEPGRNPFFCPAEFLRDHSGGNSVYRESFWIGWGWGVRSTYSQNTLLGHDAGQTGVFKMRKHVLNPDKTVMYLDGKISARCDYSFNYAKPRHQQQNIVNQVYCDGHVADMDWATMWSYTGVPQSSKPFWNPEK